MHKVTTAFAAAATLAVAALAAFGPWRAQAESIVLRKALQKPGGIAARDEFGSSVLITPDLRIVVGAQHAQVAGRNAGAAYVFDANGTPLRTLTDNTPADDDRFGASLAALGSTIAVGIPYDGDNDNESGSVALFAPTAATPTQIVKTDPVVVGALFGMSLASVGNVQLLIGAPKDDVGPTKGAGNAYLFDARTGAVLPVTPSSSASGDEYGWAVTTVGSTLVVGAPAADSGRGAVFLFDANRAFLRKITGPVLPPGDVGSRFGTALAAVGPNLVVGAPKAKGAGGSNSGVAYLYDLAGNQLRTYGEPGSAQGNLFGFALAARGPEFVASAPQDEVTAVDEAGSAYVVDAASAAIQGTIHNPEPLKQDYFGGGDEKGGSRPLARPTVATMGPLLAVGVPQDDPSGTEDAGTVYLYQLPPPPGTNYCLADADCNDGNAANGIETCVAFFCQPGDASGACADDGNGCTDLVVGADGTCRHVEREGLAALDCRLASIEAILAQNVGAFRGGFVLRLRRLTIAARAALERAKQTRGKKARRSVTKLARRMKRVIAIVDRGVPKDKIDQGIGGTMRDLASQITNRAPSVRKSLL